IVGDTGRSVPSKQPQALGDAIADLLTAGAEERTRLSCAARARVRDRFDLGAVARRYEQLYCELANRPPCVA
ncbi:MAG TPA: hypothetical protein VKT77_08215, partial [Chthonomonadaceae bacterium]|nr:hypothetical protein [Chthonomonadaceae bacterium]